MHNKYFEVSSSVITSHNSFVCRTISNNAATLTYKCNFLGRELIELTILSNSGNGKFEKSPIAGDLLKKAVTKSSAFLSAKKLISKENNSFSKNNNTPAFLCAILLDLGILETDNSLSHPNPPKFKLK